MHVDNCLTPLFKPYLKGWLGWYEATGMVWIMQGFISQWVFKTFKGRHLFTFEYHDTHIALMLMY